MDNLKDAKVNSIIKMFTKKINRDVTGIYDADTMWLIKSCPKGNPLFAPDPFYLMNKADGRIKHISELDNGPQILANAYDKSIYEMDIPDEYYDKMMKDIENEE